MSMKLALKFSIITVCQFIFLLCISDLSTKTYNQNETQRLSQVASYQALKQASTPYQNIKSNEQLVGEVLKEVVLNKSSDCDIEVEILDVDYLNGLIDLKIKQTFQHVNGKKTEIESRRTIILEEDI